MTEDTSEEEQYLMMAINALSQAYVRDTKPYVDRLVAIRNMKRPSFIVSRDELERLQILMQAEKPRKLND